MEIKQKENRIWIEITNQKGFLMFGDLSRYQKAQGINISSNEVDIICNNCPHKLRFKKNEIEETGVKGKVWDWWKWRVFLRANQLSKGKRDYYVELRVEFYCTHCQAGLPARSNY